MEYRLTLCFPKTDPGSPNPDIKSKDEWNRIKSTKMDVCAQICQHYLLRDDVPDVEFIDGKPVFPKLKPSKGSSKIRKILIYSEFPSMTSLLVKVRSFLCHWILYHSFVLFRSWKFTVLNVSPLMEMTRSTNGPTLLLHSSKMVGLECLSFLVSGQLVSTYPLPMLLYSL